MPMLVILGGRIKVPVSALQPENAALSILVSVGGSCKPVSCLHFWNAPALMLVIIGGRDKKPVSRSQSLKAKRPMLVIVGGRIKAPVSPLQPANA